MNILKSFFNYLGRHGFTGKALFLSVVGALSWMIKGAANGVVKNREKQKEAERRQAEFIARREARRRERKEELQRDGYQVLEIEGILHFKNQHGNWEPVRNKRNSDIKFTKKGEDK